MKNSKIKMISSRAEHKKALATIQALWDSTPGSEAHDTLEVLSVLVDPLCQRSCRLDREIGMNTQGA